MREVHLVPGPFVVVETVRLGAVLAVVPVLVAEHQLPDGVRSVPVNTKVVLHRHPDE